MMMKQQYNQQQQQQQHQQQMQQQQQHTMNGGGGSQQGGNTSPPLHETKWWYKGPDGETYGPYSPKEMHTWNGMGYFSEGLLVRTENDDLFHPYGDWLIVMRGTSPFTSPTVPAFGALVQSHQQAAAAAQYHLYPPGLPAPQSSANGSSNGGAGGGGASGPGRFGGPPPPSQPQQPGAYGQPQQMSAAAVEAMARMHMGAGDARMGMMGPMHMGGPLSQPPSEPTDGPPHSQSPDNNEPDFRSLHHMGGPPPPSMPPTMHPAAVAAAAAAAAAAANRMQFGYGMPPMQQMQQQSVAPLQQSQQQQHSMIGGGGGGGSGAGAPLTHASNGQLQYSRVTSTADAPWNSRREMAVDATQRAAPRATIATQTLPVIIGSKDASRLLSDLTGCSIVIT